METLPPTAGKRPIAVIGAGFSGTIAALHLLRRLPADQPVLLCERAPEFARGLPYASGDADQLLNVRATNMSALADDPHHFAEWLKNRLGDTQEGLYSTDAGLFATRGLYARYLRHLLDQALRGTAGHAPLQMLAADIIDVVAGDNGGYVLRTAADTTHEVAGVVLAVGSPPPAEHAHPRISTDPWSEKAKQPATGSVPVLVVGTGLTMVDHVLELRRRGVTAPLIAISRAGLLPNAHGHSSPWPTPHFTLAEEQSLSLMMARLRDEVFLAAEQGVGWRCVVDSLRPITASLWARLPIDTRRRFLRHARRYWDVHRHRMAPPHAEALDAMRADGSLRVLAGTVARLEPHDTGVRVHYRLRGSLEPREMTAQRVVFATEVQRIAGTQDRLMRRLQERGLVRMDAQGLGIDVTDGLNVIRADHSVAERVWALGPVVRGVFWECVAVPDTRVQASHVAVSVVATLRETAPRMSF